jgi:sec-independent protein translocase protein TatA
MYSLAEEDMDRRISRMNVILAFGGLGGWEILAVLFILLLLFGGTRLPQLASGLGKSIRSFKKGLAEGEEDTALDEAKRRAALNSDSTSSELDKSRLSTENSTINRSH